LGGSYQVAAPSSSSLGPSELMPVQKKPVLLMQLSFELHHCFFDPPPALAFFSASTTAG
jgi:hypothetical protein